MVKVDKDVMSFDYDTIRPYFSAFRDCTAKGPRRMDPNFDFDALHRHVDLSTTRGQHLIPSLPNTFALRAILQSAMPKTPCTDLGSLVLPSNCFD